MASLVSEKLRKQLSMAVDGLKLFFDAHIDEVRRNAAIDSETTPSNGLPLRIRRQARSGSMSSLRRAAASVGVSGLTIEKRRRKRNGDPSMVSCAAGAL